MSPCYGTHAQGTHTHTHTHTLLQEHRHRRGRHNRSQHCLLPRAPGGQVYSGGAACRCLRGVRWGLEWQHLFASLAPFHIAVGALVSTRLRLPPQQPLPSTCPLSPPHPLPSHASRESRGVPGSGLERWQPGGGAHAGVVCAACRTGAGVWRQHWLQACPHAFGGLAQLACCCPKLKLALAPGAGQCPPRALIGLIQLCAALSTVSQTASPQV